MARHLRSVDGAIHPGTVLAATGTVLAATGTALHPPLLGMVLGACGLILLVSGMVDAPSPATPARRGWAHAQVVNTMTAIISRQLPRPWTWTPERPRPWSDPGDASPNARPLPSAADAGQGLERAASLQPDSLQLAIVTSRVLRKDSEEQIANAFFGPVSDQPPVKRSWMSRPSFTADEQAPNFDIPSEEWDVRWGLMEMAGAQRGHWTRQCPCPFWTTTIPPESGP